MADEKDCGAQHSVYHPDRGKTITFTCSKWADHPASHYDFHAHVMWPHRLYVEVEDGERITLPPGMTDDDLIAYIQRQVDAKASEAGDDRG